MLGDQPLQEEPEHSLNATLNVRHSICSFPGENPGWYRAFLLFHLCPCSILLSFRLLFKVSYSVLSLVYSVGETFHGVFFFNLGFVFHQIVFHFLRLGSLQYFYLRLMCIHILHHLLYFAQLFTFLFPILFSSFFLSSLSGTSSISWSPDAHYYRINNFWGVMLSFFPFFLCYYSGIYTAGIISLPCLFFTSYFTYLQCSHDT